jgi:hypothetical protein
VTIFDLLFILVFLASVVTLGAAGVAALRGHRRRAFRLLVGWAISAAIYLGAVVVVALTSPQRILAIGEDRCFDDWCVAVEDVTVVRELGPGDRVVRADGLFYVVTLRLSNHGRGRAQRASSAAVHLIDERGRMYEVSEQGQQAFEAQYGPALPLTSTVGVGQFLNTVRVFDLPADAHGIGLTVAHPVGPSPGLFIIGDDASLFHKPTIIRLN